MMRQRIFSPDFLFLLYWNILIVAGQNKEEEIVPKEQSPRDGFTVNTVKNNQVLNITSGVITNTLSPDKLNDDDPLSEVSPDFVIMGGEGGGGGEKEEGRVWSTFPTSPTLSSPPSSSSPEGTTIVIVTLFDLVQSSSCNSFPSGLNGLREDVEGAQQMAEAAKWAERREKLEERRIIIEQQTTKKLINSFPGKEGALGA